MNLKGEFFRIEQDVHDVGTSDDAMVSRVHFRIRKPDGQLSEGTAMVKQTAGGNYGTDPLEVGDVTYTSEGPKFKFEGFRDQVELYYRAGFGRTFRISNSSVRMRNNIIDIRAPFEVEAIDGGAGW